MQINLLNKNNRDSFCALFKDYYEELGCDEDVDHLLDEYVLADCDAGLLRIAVAIDGAACGFVIYQIDSIENEWCLKEGMGTVRELYVSHARRGGGVGTKLMEFAEGQLKEGGAKGLYILPAEGTQAFFISRGYEESDEFCEDMDCNFFYKAI